MPAIIGLQASKFRKTRLAEGDRLKRSWPSPVATQTAGLIRSAKQQKEECPLCLVFGSGPFALRPLHNNLPFGCMHAPPPDAAALFQLQFKNGKSIQALRCSFVPLVFCPSNSAKVQGDASPPHDNDR